MRLIRVLVEVMDVPASSLFFPYPPMYFDVHVDEDARQDRDGLRNILQKNN